MAQKAGYETSGKKQITGIAVVIVLIIITVLVLKSKAEDIKFHTLMEIILKLKPGYILLALLSMVIYVVIEGRCLAAIGRRLGYSMGWKETSVYAAADIYFSAITPSATGGQPASAYYMAKDGIKVSDSSTILVLNILMYTLSLIVMGGIALAVKAGFLMTCPRLFKILYCIGWLTQILLLILCIVCMFSREKIKGFGEFLIKILYKLRFVKNKEEKTATVNGFIERYQSGMELIKKKPGMLVEVFIGNVLQRMAFFTAGYFVYRSFGFDMESYFNIVVMQLLLMMAVNSLPVPGAVGVSEGSFLAIFGGIFVGGALIPGMIVTRMINYYICFTVCGIVTIIYHISIVRRNSGRKSV